MIDKISELLYIYILYILWNDYYVHLMYIKDYCNLLITFRPYLFSFILQFTYICTCFLFYTELTFILAHGIEVNSIIIYYFSPHTFYITIRRGWLKLCILTKMKVLLTVQSFQVMQGIDNSQCNVIILYVSCAHELKGYKIIQHISMVKVVAS